MSHTHASPTARKGRRRTRQVALGAVAMLFGVLPGAIAGAAQAAPTAPPPVTILSSQPNIGQATSSSRRSATRALTPTARRSSTAMATSSGSSPSPRARRPADFRTQTYHGQPVLTFWQGTGLGGLASGTDYIYNDHYQQIATVNAGNGLSADGHEFLITPWNTALILSYTTATADLTSIGGPADQTVVDGVVQEVDIATGKVLFQWNSADHVPYSQSEQPLPSSASTPWDWFHINAVKLDTDGNLLIDARDTWTTYKVSPTSGNVIWQLGGKDSDFTVQQPRDRRWTAQTRYSPGSTIQSRSQQRVQSSTTSLGAGVAPLQPRDPGEVEPSIKVAALIPSDNHPTVSAASQGNVQAPGDDHLFVGWGSRPYISEFDAPGQAHLRRRSLLL